MTVVISRLPLVNPKRLRDREVKRHEGLQYGCRLRARASKPSWQDLAMLDDLGHLILPPCPL